MGCLKLTETEKQPRHVSVVALRAEGYSTEGDIFISLRTKYSTAERKYSVPLECFQDLIVDLKRLNDPNNLSINTNETSDKSATRLRAQHTRYTSELKDRYDLLRPRVELLTDRGG
jgi:hypothetical protein